MGSIAILSILGHANVGLNKIANHAAKKANYIKPTLNIPIPPTDIGNCRKDFYESGNRSRIA